MSVSPRARVEPPPAGGPPADVRDAGEEAAGSAAPLLGGRIGPSRAWRAGAVACLLVAEAVAIYGLVGWAAGLPGLRHFGSSLPEMKLNSAVAFALLAVAVHLSTRSGRWARVVVRAVAVLVLALAVVVLVAYALGAPTAWLDELVVHDPSRIRFPGRPSPLTAACVACLGAALLARPFGRGRVADALGLLAFAGGGAGLLGYAYSGNALAGERPIEGMSLPSAFAVVLVALALASQRTDRGVVGLLRSPGAGGEAARRMVPVALLVPVAAGFVVRGLGRTIGREAADALLVLATAALGVTVAAWVAVRLERSDLERRRASREEARLAEERARSEARADLEADGRRRADERRAVSERLRTLAEGLSSALSPLDVLVAATRELAGAANASSASAGVVDPEAPGTLVTVGIGLGASGDGSVERILLSEPMAVTAAVRDGHPRWLASRDEIVTAFPAARARLDGAHIGAAAVLPLRSDGGILGFVALGRSDPHEFGEAEREVLSALASQIAAALDRARIFDRERRAHAEAERLRADLAFVARVSTAMERRIGFRQRAERLAVAAAERFAATVAVVELADDRRPVIAALAGGGPAHEEAAAALRSVAATFGGDRPVARHARGGLVLALGVRNVTVGACWIRTAAPLDAAEVRLAEDLARRAGPILENARLYDHERETAQALQRGLLPPALPKVDGLELAADYRPFGAGDEVGGDFYDAIAIGGGVLLVVGDVCGKGPEAARLTGIARHTLRAHARREPDPRPSLLLTLLDDALLAETGGTTFCTAIVVRARSRPDGCVLVEVASGGHPPLVVRRANGRVERLEPRGSLLGIGAGVAFQQAGTLLAPGDAALLYTDGVIEARRPHRGPLYGEERLGQVASAAGGSAEALLEAVDRDIDRHARGHLRDDVAMLALRVPGGAPARPQIAPLTLRAPAVPSCLPAIRRAVRAWLERAGAGREDIRDILIATGEVVTNVVEHARPPDQRDGVVDLLLRLEGADEVVVVVRDRGRWRPPREAPTRGRGLTIARRASDEMIALEGAAGSEVRLRRRLRGAPTGSLPGDAAPSAGGQLDPVPSRARTRPPS